MEFVYEAFLKTFGQVWHTLSANWIFLLASIIIAVILKRALNPERTSALLMRYRKVGVLAATVFAVVTPFCSCGTTAVVLGMIAGMMPWAPIVAFMAASPLTSPEELIYSAGLFGWPFALTFFFSSILVGLVAGFAASFMEGKGWLKNQVRFSLDAQAAPAAAPACGCSSSEAEPAAKEPEMQIYACCASEPIQPKNTCGCQDSPKPVEPPVKQAEDSCGCSQSAQKEVEPPLKQAEVSCGCSQSAPKTVETAPRQGWQEKVGPILQEAFQTGGRLLAMFIGFAFIGYMINNLIPSSWVVSLFGTGQVHGVLAAATLGLPFYVNTEGSLPLVRTFLDSGMSQGAALAFLITGAGTSFGAIAGALTIARWRVVGLVIGTLWVSAVVIGYAYDAVLMAGLI